MPILVMILLLAVVGVIIYFVFRNTAIGKTAGAVADTGQKVAETGSNIVGEVGKLASPLTLSAAIQKRLGGGTKAEAKAWQVLVTYLFNYSKRCTVSRPKDPYAYKPTVYATKGSMLYARLPHRGIRPWLDHPDTSYLQDFLVVTPNAIILTSSMMMVMLPEELNTLTNIITALRPNVDDNGDTDTPFVFDRDYCPIRIAHALRALTASVPEFAGKLGHPLALVMDPSASEIRKYIGITGTAVIFVMANPSAEPKASVPYTLGIRVLEEMWNGSIAKGNFQAAPFADAPDDLNHGQFAGTAAPAVIDPAALQAEVDKYASQTF